MIVTCAKCATQFQLDEARVPETGIRVRCSLCKHAFFVEHPDAIGEISADPVTRAVEEVLEAESPELPGAHHDLEPADPHAGAAPEGARDEEDWEWSDGGRLGAPAQVPEDRFEESFEAARAAVDDLLGSPEEGPQAVGFAALPAEPEPQAEPEPMAPSPALASPAEESPIPPVEEEVEIPLSDDPWDAPGWSDGASDPEGRAAAPLPELVGEGEALASGPDPGRLDDTGSLDLGGGELDPFADELADERADPPESGLAMPERLDLDELETPESPPGEEPLTTPSGLELELEMPPAAPPLAGPATAARAVERVAEPTTAARAVEWVAEPLPVGLGARLEPERIRAIGAAFARVGSAIGWSVVALLAAGMFWASVTPRTAPGAGAGVQSVAGLEATGVEGRWVENAIVGPIYVVRGALRNAGAEPRAPGARLVVRLLDAEGSPLEAPTASLAPPAPAAWLREAHPRELRDAREAAAQRLARTPLAPGASIPFEAVVESLPEAARRFDLAVAPSGAAPGPEGS